MHTATERQLNPNPKKVLADRLLIQRGSEQVSSDSIVRLYLSPYKLLHSEIADEEPGDMSSGLYI